MTKTRRVYNIYINMYSIGSIYIIYIYSLPRLLSGLTFTRSLATIGRSLASTRVQPVICPRDQSARASRRRIELPPITLQLAGSQEWVKNQPVAYSREGILWLGTSKYVYTRLSILARNGAVLVLLTNQRSPPYRWSIFQLYLAVPVFDRKITRYTRF